MCLHYALVPHPPKPWTCGSASILKNLYRGFVCCAMIKHEPLWEDWRYLSSLTRIGKRGVTSALLLLCSISTYWKGPFSHFGAAWSIQLIVCMNMALRGKKGLAVHLPTDLGYGEMGAFLLLLEVWAMVTQNVEHDAIFFHPNERALSGFKSRSQQLSAVDPKSMAFQPWCWFRECDFLNALGQCCIFTRKISVITKFLVQMLLIFRKYGNAFVLAWNYYFCHPVYPVMWLNACLVVLS